MKHIRETAAALSATGLLLSGCTAESPVQAPAEPTTAVETPGGLVFQTEPTENFSVSDCWTNPNGWAVSINESGNYSPDNPRLNVATVGMAQEMPKPDGYPILVAGATVRALGGTTYQLATANHAPGETTTVDLQNESFSEIQPAEEGYDVAFSARLGSDGRAYFTANCLPEFGYNGNTTPIPLGLDDFEMPPAEEQNPTQTV